MNTQTTTPSDAAIAQAFRECAGRKNWQSVQLDEFIFNVNIRAAALQATHPAGGAGEAVPYGWLEPETGNFVDHETKLSMPSDASTYTLAIYTHPAPKQEGGEIDYKTAKFISEHWHEYQDGPTPGAAVVVGDGMVGKVLDAMRKDLNHGYLGNSQWANKWADRIEAALASPPSAVVCGDPIELLELAADFETCIPFLPINGQRNIAERVKRLRCIASIASPPAAQSNDNAIALIEACSKLHRENHPLVSPTEPELPVRTRILINLEGGLVQAVLADRELVDVIIIDYDTEGADDDEITEIQQDDGDWAEALARIEVATVDPVFINRAFDNINQET